jgi:hypothetical protein
LTPQTERRNIDKQKERKAKIHEKAAQHFFQFQFGKTNRLNLHQHCLITRKNAAPKNTFTMCVGSHRQPQHTMRRKTSQKPIGVEHVELFGRGPAFDFWVTAMTKQQN